MGSWRDLIAFCAFHSFLVEVQMNAILVPRARLSWSRGSLQIKARGSGDENGLLHTCDACVITTCRLGLRAPPRGRRPVKCLGWEGRRELWAAASSWLLTGSSV